MCADRSTFSTATLVRDERPDTTLGGGRKATQCNAVRRAGSRDRAAGSEPPRRRKPRPRPPQSPPTGRFAKRWALSLALAWPGSGLPESPEPWAEAEGLRVASTNRTTRWEQSRYPINIFLLLDNPIRAASTTTGLYRGARRATVGSTRPQCNTSPGARPDPTQGRRTADQLYRCPVQGVRRGRTRTFASPRKSPSPGRGRAHRRPRARRPRSGFPRRHGVRQDGPPRDRDGMMMRRVEHSMDDLGTEIVKAVAVASHEGIDPPLRASRRPPERGRASTRRR